MRVTTTSLIFTFLLNCVWAQAYDIALFGVSEGLPQSQVTSLQQDQHGFLWIGTVHGVARFDGREFLRLGGEDGLCNNFVNDLQFDLAGNLWIATDRGLARIDAPDLFRPKEKVNCLATQYILSHEHISALARHPDGSIWLAGDMGLITIPHPTEESPKLLPPPQKGSCIRSEIHHLHIDQGGDIYAAATESIWTLTADSCKRIPLPEAYQKTTINQLFLDEEGCLWFSSKTAIYKTCGEEWRVLESLGSKGYHCNCDAVRSFLKDSHGALWLGGTGCLSWLNNGQWKQLTCQDGLPGFDAKTLLEDSEGNVWAGINGGGLARLTPNRFRIHNRKNGLENDFVLSVVRGPDSLVWVGTTKGLYQQQTDGWRHYDLTRLGFNQEEVRSLACSSEGRLYFGTGTELGYWEAGAFHHLRPDGWIKPDETYGTHAILSSKRWHALFGVSHHLFQFDGAEFRPLVLPHKSGISNIRAIAERADGSLVVGGANVRPTILARSPQSQEIREIFELPMPRDLEGLAVRAIQVGPEGLSWVGLLGGGVVV